MTQEERVLDYLHTNGSINPMQALNDCGVMRLAARIGKIKSMGHSIDSKMVTVKNRWGESCRVAVYSINAKAHRPEMASTGGNDGIRD